MAHPNARHQPYDAVAALTRHINQRNREIARQKHSPDQLKALSEKYNGKRSLPKKCYGLGYGLLQCSVARDLDFRE